MMNREVYLACRRALAEAREVLDIVPVTNSPSLAAAACHRALQLCLLLDDAVGRTDATREPCPEEALDRFVARHPDLFIQAGILAPVRRLQQTGHLPPALEHDQASLEQVFLPAARAIRLMLDGVAAGIRAPRRPWRRHAAVFAALLGMGGLILSVRWAVIMTSREGLTVTYYSDMNMRKPVAQRVEQHVFKDYGPRRPALWAPRCGYSARWEGQLYAPSTTNYSFFSQCAGGIRVYIDGEPIIDKWQEQVWESSGMHGERFLSSGPHRLTVEHFKNRGNGALRLRWSGGEVADNSVVGVPYVTR